MMSDRMKVQGNIWYDLRCCERSARPVLFIHGAREKGCHVVIFAWRDAFTCELSHGLAISDERRVTQLSPLATGEGFDDVHDVAKAASRDYHVISPGLSA